MKYKGNILVTGSRGGFGHGAALALAKLGYFVYASTETEEEARIINRQAKQEKLPIESFKLDIASPADRQKITSLDLDVLINNAAVGESGSLADIPMERLRRSFEVNVFGTLALTQLALGGMIAKKSGRIIFISSLAGRVSMPFMGAYSMTKFSLSCAAETLRSELARLNANIHVSVVEPGAYHTGFNQKMFATKYSWMPENSYFWSIMDSLKIHEQTRFASIEQPSIDSLVRQIVRAVRDERPKLRYTAPWWQAWGVQIQRIFGR